MNRSLALHHFTIADVSPLELVPIAAEVGCDGVCIFVESPGEPAPGQDLEQLTFPVVTRAMQRQFARRLSDYGVGVTNIEFFPLGPDTRIDSFREKLALGAELGARLAVTHVHDPVTERAVATLSALSEAAAEFELQVGLEFMGLSAACDSLDKAVELVAAADQDNLGVAVDALHLQLTGGTPEQVARLDPATIAYAQLCDGPVYDVLPLDTERYLAEAFERQVPGEGRFPLRELVRALPEHTFYDVEVPMPSLAQKGVSALERAERAVQGARSLLTNH